jgi:hypothetical protein
MRSFLSVILFYTITSVLFLLPLIQGCTSQIPAGDGSYDGYQFLWNLWWVRMVFEGDGSLFYTELLFAPHGTPLVLHSLSPANGLFSLPIQYIFNDHRGLIAALNLLTIGHFIFLACTIHILCRKIDCSSLASIGAALLITFLPYRLHHLHHLNLLSTGWLVLAMYALVWMKEKTTSWKPILTLSLSSSLLLYSDHEQSLCLGILITIFCIVFRATLSFRSLFFAMLGILCITIPLWIALLSFPPDQYLSTQSMEFSTNILSLFSPTTTEPIINQWADTNIESQPGWIFWLFILAGIRLYFPLRSFFLWTAFFFGLLSLGASLTVGATQIDIPLPYDLLHNGWLQLGRAPIRFMPISCLLLAVVAARGWTQYNQSIQWSCVAVILLFRWPSSIPMERVELPIELQAVQKDHRQYSIWHTKESYKSIQKDMFFQTIHRHPISGGYTARIWKPAYTWKKSISSLPKPISTLQENGFGLIQQSASNAEQQWLISPP